jgi:ATP-dependent protease ClpP protease subunit
MISPVLNTKRKPSTVKPQSAPRAAAPARPAVRPLPYMTAEITLTGGISGEVWSINLATVSREFATAKAGNARAVLLSINSVGGDANEAFNVNAALRLFSRSTGPVIAYIGPYARAASGATIVALAADFIIVDPAAVGMMVHAPSGGTPEVRSLATNRLVSLYRDRTSLGSEDAIRGLLEGCGDTWLAPGACLDDGFADEIAERERAVEVARACAARAPMWPEAVWSPRRAALQVREAYAAAARR